MNENLDQKIEIILKPISEKITGIVFGSFSFFETEIPFIVLWLVFASLYFSFYFRFLNIFYFKRALRVAFGKYDNPRHRRNNAFSIFHCCNVRNNWFRKHRRSCSCNFYWRARSNALDDNYSLFGMTLKFVEVSLGHKYRIIHKDGTVSGGAIRYLSDGLGQMGYLKLGKILAIFFAICCIGGSFGGGNMFQANQAFQQIVEATGAQNSPLYNKGWLGGIIFSIIVGCIIIGGIKSIGKVTEKLVPIKAFVYVFSCIYIIVINIDLLPETILKIFSSAFNLDATVGGFLGSLIAGVKRAVFSNESGIDLLQLLMLQQKVIII